MLKDFSRKISNGFRGTAGILCAAMVSLWFLQAAGSASGEDIADIAPQDSLLYLEVSDPAAFLNDFEKTELRQAAKSAFAAELVITFAKATADLIAKSLTDLSLHETIEHYGLKVGIVASPPFAAQPRNELKPRFALILRPEKNAAELKRAIDNRLKNAISSRFPRTKITEEQLHGHEVTTIESPRGRISAFAFIGKPAPDYIVYGRKPAVRWLLNAQKFLAESKAYQQGRAQLELPASADIFCFAEATPKAAEISQMVTPGTLLVGYLDILTKTQPSPVYDKILLIGDLNLPDVGPAMPPQIGRAFPQGPYEVNQISFESGSTMFDYCKITPQTHFDNAQLDSTLSGLGYLSTTLADGSYYMIAAGQISDKADAINMLENLLKDAGYTKNQAFWDSEGNSALIYNDIIYIAKKPAIRKLYDDFSAEKPALADNSSYSDRFGRLPRRSCAYSLMTPSFLAGPGWLKGIDKFLPLVENLPLSVASAEKTSEGAAITSISPAGYGLWLVSLNVAAALEEEDQ